MTDEKVFSGSAPDAALHPGREGGPLHRWICSEAGEDGKAYPILVNSNLERMDVKITASGIEVKTYGEDGDLKHQWNKAR